MGRESTERVHMRTAPGRALSRLMVAATIALCAVSASGAESADSKLSAFFKQYLEERLAMHPLQATELGDHRFDHLLDDLSKKALDGSLAHLRKTLAELPR